MRSSASRSAVLAVGLIAAVGCVFLAARLFGLTGDGDQQLARRLALCEGLSVGCSQLAEAEQWDSLEAAVRRAVSLHPDLAAASLVHDDGRVLWTIRTAPDAPELDAAHQALVDTPLFRDGSRWGSLRLTFAEPRPNWFLAIALPTFVAAMCFVIFTVLLRYILQRLSGSDEPSEAVQQSLDSISASVVLLDDRERIALANRAFCELTGHSLASLTGSKIWALPWRADAELPWKKTLREGVATSNVSLRLIPQRREPRKLYVNCAPLPGLKGRIRGAVVSFTDVTEKEHHLRELKIARSALLDSAMRTAVVSRVTQRLIGPAGSLATAAAGLRRGLGGDAAGAAARYGQLAQNGRRIVALLQDMLDLQRMESGAIALARRSCSPHAVLAEVYRTFLPRAAEKGLTLEFVSEGPLPMAVHTDPDRLERIVSHLVDNAIKFSEAGRIVVAAKVERLEDRHQLRVDVQDQGPGVASDLASEIVTPFAELGRGRRGGMGLAVSKRSAEALGGGLSWISDPGQGSCFTVRVDTGPLKSVSSRPLRQRDLQPRRVEEERPLGFRFHGKVLVADNDHDVRQTLRLALEALGLRVTLAADGRAVLQAARGLDFDLMLLDTRLASLDGVSATRLLRRHGFQRPIVALTDNPAEQEACRQAGFTRMLMKPLQLDPLVLCLQRTLTAEPLADVPTASRPNDDEATTPYPDEEAFESAGEHGPWPAPASVEAKETRLPAPARTGPAGTPPAIPSPPQTAAAGRDAAPPAAEPLEQATLLSPELAASDGLSASSVRFLESFEARRLRLAAMTRDNEIQRLQQEAADLQRTARSAGFPAMADAAADLVQMARQGDRSGQEMVLERLEALVECFLSPDAAPPQDPLR